MRKNKLLLLLALLLTAATGAMAQDYYAPSTDEVIILNEVYNASNSGKSSHSAIAWGGSASTSNKRAGDPNNGGQQTSKTVSCYSVKGNGQGKNITLSITGVSKVIVYHESHASRYIELRDGSKTGNIIGSGQINTYYTEVALTATNEYSIFLHGTSNGSDDQDFNVYAIKLIAAAAPATVAVTGVTLDKTSAEMTVGGDALTLTATVAPDGATDQTVTWTTSDANVATVANGVVTAVAAGTATITATATNGTDDTSDDKTATCTVTVAAAAAGYSVSLKDGTVDAGNWSIEPKEGLSEGDQVTVKYNGRLKVKGVKATSDAAPAAKEPATVTAAPTGAAIVGVGKSTALVSGGVADGGTLMYAVTTENTKPASTDGFSDAVPTAQTITASGKVYVWYYVKGDDTHSDSEIAATAIEVPVADIIWDATNVSDLDISDDGASYEKEGVTLSCNADQIQAAWDGSGGPTENGIGFNTNDFGGFTFTAPTGKAFTKIEMTVNASMGWDSANLGSGWAFKESMICTVTWTGSAASTVGLLTDDNGFSGPYAKSIVFYLSE